MNSNKASIQASNLSRNTNWRCANAAQIAAGLQQVRTKIIEVFDVYVAADSLTVSYADELNPPLWELGHIAWFQEYWIGRNPQRHLGIRYDVKQARLPSVLAQADSWYNSSLVPHASRWHLPLPAPQACKAYLAQSLSQTLGLLEKAGDDDDALYFYRLALFHEAMHLEAAIYMAQAVSLKIDLDLSTAKSMKKPSGGQIGHIKQVFKLGYMERAGDVGLAADTAYGGSDLYSGFAFDNELQAHPVQVDAFAIDPRCVNWGEYLQFVDASSHRLPRYVRRSLQRGGSGFESQHFGVWQALDLQAIAVHINFADAQAYCAWAGRRLPTEAEWELAASTPGVNKSDNTKPPIDFVWGEVWEWTSSVFAPYPGFVAHPYADYSAPWFGTRQVLRGACAATQPMMKNSQYRNFFTPDRDDIYAGFRTCAV